MPFVLVRVDDRLIHGQVVVGWAIPMNPDRLILCHDQIAQSSWEKELYLSSQMEYDFQFDIWSTEQTVAYAKSPHFQKEKALLLVESPADVLRLIHLGVSIPSVNIGGMRHREGKKALASYIYVDEKDAEVFRKLAALGVNLEGRDVPNAKKIDILRKLDQVFP